ncbi:MAG: hypothetical protein AB4063_00620 [Crocosphaera sp.]
MAEFKNYLIGVKTGHLPYAQTSGSDVMITLQGLLIFEIPKCW